MPEVKSPALRVFLAVGLAVMIPLAYSRSAEWAGTGSYFVLAFLAVIASAWLGRLASGLITLVACALLSIYFFPVPNPEWTVDAQRARLTLLFLIGGGLICLFIEALHFGHSVASRLRQESETLARQLAAERERLHAFLANLPGVVWEAALVPGSQRPEMSFMSPNVESRLGWKPEALNAAESAWRTVLHPDDEQALWSALQAVRPGTVGRVRGRWMDPAGAVRWFDTYFSSGPGVATVADCIRCVSVDVTDAERAERAVENSELRFRATAERAPMMMWRADPQGNTTWANRAWLEFRGRAMDFELGLGWLRDVHPDDLDGVARALTRTAGSKEEVRLEYRIRRNDESFPWVFSLRLPQTDSADALDGYLGFVIDISERKELDLQRERLLRETQRARLEAEIATRSKDDFLAKVSHELRNPLNGILGWAQLLRRDDIEPEEMTRGLAMLESGARALSQLVDDLLDVSRIIAGKMDLALEQTDLRAVLDAAIATVTPAAEAKGVVLEGQLPEGLPPVMGDPRRLRQVAWNLFANGVKFTPRGGRVRWAVERQGSQLVLRVTDTGIGIASEFLPEVFSPFRQGESTTTRRYQGLGLGLAIVRQLVELHGGTVEAESAGLDQGSTFTVRLPVASVTPAPHPVLEEPDNANAAALAGVTVLVVDDDPTARELLHLLLSRVGAECREAASPSEARALIEKGLPNVIVSDIEMPNEDGYSFLRALRALEPGLGGSIPAIALTAFAQQEDRKRTALAGFQAHLAKPVDAELLVNTIAQMARPN